jgi:hypothetical protein
LISTLDAAVLILGAIAIVVGSLIALAFIFRLAIVPSEQELERLPSQRSPVRYSGHSVVSPNGVEVTPNADWPINAIVDTLCDVERLG